MTLDSIYSKRTKSNINRSRSWTKVTLVLFLLKVMCLDLFFDSQIYDLLQLEGKIIKKKHPKVIDSRILHLAQLWQ